MSTGFIAIKDDQVARTTVQEAIKRIKKSGWIEGVREEKNSVINGDFLGIKTVCNNHYWFPIRDEEGEEMIENMIRNGKNSNEIAEDVIVVVHGADFAVSEHQYDLWDTYVPYDCDDDLEDEA